MSDVRAGTAGASVATAEASAPASSRLPWWSFLLIAVGCVCVVVILVIAIVVCCVRRRRRRRRCNPHPDLEHAPQPLVPASAPPTPPPPRKCDRRPGRAAALRVSPSPRFLPSASAPAAVAAAVCPSSSDGGTSDSFSATAYSCFDEKDEGTEAETSVSRDEGDRASARETALVMGSALPDCDTSPPASLGLFFAFVDGSPSLVSTPVVTPLSPPSSHRPLHHPERSFTNDAAATAAAGVAVVEKKGEHDGEGGSDARSLLDGASASPLRASQPPGQRSNARHIDVDAIQHSATRRTRTSRHMAASSSSAQAALGVTVSTQDDETEEVDLMDPNRQLTKAERVRLQQLRGRETADPAFGAFLKSARRSSRGEH